MPHTRPSPFIFISGGCRSGKSAYAQALAERMAPERLYLATAGVYDDEMQTRVERHKELRGPGWRTYEMNTAQPLELWRCLPDISRPGEPLLLDCLTLWAAACMSGDEPAPDFDTHCRRLLHTLHGLPCPVILVSGEVGMGVVPPSKAGRTFRDMAGTASQLAAGLAFPAVLMISGIPLAIKGFLPETDF